MANLDELLEDDGDEVSQELSIIFTKKGKVYFVTPEVTVDGVNETAKLLAHLIINWGHIISEQLKNVDGLGLTGPKISLGGMTIKK
jgi:hypothetical protein